uniref:Uncharacterized protein n=1 Tax=Anguilla anguilla TaxID=7936 RepID=A0A0E9RLL5_ANGAN
MPLNQIQMCHSCLHSARARLHIKGYA